MANEYWKADEAQEIAQQYLGMHPDLIGANIAFLFKTKATKRDGVPVVGKAMKVPERYKPLMEETDSGDKGYDFILEFGADAWQELGPDTKAAWVDFCLEQCYGEEKDDGTIVWKLRKPEIVGFPVIFNRHGVGWHPGANKLRTLNINEEPTLKAPTRREVQAEQDASLTQDVTTS